MDIWYILMTPFTWLLKLFYGFFSSYGIAVILFTLVVKILLFPLSLKGKRSMIQMNMLSGQMQKLQKQFGKDQNRYNMEVQKLYEKEGVSPTGGCLWSMLPVFIMFPLYAVIRRPLKYWLGLTDSVIGAVTTAVLGEGVSAGGYSEIAIASRFFTDPASLELARPVAEGAELYGINFDFLGINLGATPNLKFWEGGITWGSVGLLLIPVLCAVTALLSSVIMMKTNQINSQAAENPQSKSMMLMSPIMMLVFGFVMPAGMGVYIIANSVFSVFQEILCGRILKKDYEAAAEKKRQQEIEEKEEEKRLRRERAERRARELEEAKNKKKKKEAAGEDSDDKMTPEQRAASRSGMRQYARGRAYDPARYGEVTPYDEGRIEAMLARDSAKENKGRKKAQDQEKKDDQ